MDKDTDLETSFSFTGTVAKPSGNPFSNDKQFGIGAVLVGKTCLMFGGYSRREEKHRIYTYDYVNMSWKSHLPAVNPRMFGRVRMSFLVNDLLYVYIWSTRYKEYTFLVLDLMLMEEWEDIGRGACPQLNFGTSGSFVEARNEAVLFGGRNEISEKGATDVHVYDVSSCKWYSPKAKGKPPAARYNHTTCCTGTKVFVLGGISIRPGGRFPTLVLSILSIKNSRFEWSTPTIKGYVPQGRFLFHASCTQGRIFVYGGYGGYTRFDIYSIKEERWYEGVDSSPPLPGEVRFRTKWVEGTSDHASVLTSNLFLVVGGFRLSACAPLHITPD